MKLTEKLNSIKAKVIDVRCGTRFYSVLLDRVQNTASNRTYLKEVYGDREIWEIVKIPEILDPVQPVAIFITKLDNWRR